MSGMTFPFWAKGDRGDTLVEVVAAIAIATALVLVLSYYALALDHTMADEMQNQARVYADMVMQQYVENNANPPEQVVQPIWLNSRDGTEASANAIFGAKFSFTISISKPQNVNATLYTVTVNGENQGGTIVTATDQAMR